MRGTAVLLRILAPEPAYSSSRVNRGFFFDGQFQFIAGAAHIFWSSNNFRFLKITYAAID
jgi:hypothetical protein